jgi:hypothetical protein
MQKFDVVPLFENSSTFRQGMGFYPNACLNSFSTYKNGFKLSIGDFKSVMDPVKGFTVSFFYPKQQIPPLLDSLMAGFTSLVLQSSQCFRCVNSKDTDFVWHE